MALLGCLGIIFLVAFMNAVIAFVVMVCWNLVAPVFGWPSIEYIHALAITVLFSLVTGYIRNLSK